MADTSDCNFLLKGADVFVGNFLHSAHATLRPEPNDIGDVNRIASSPVDALRRTGALA